MKIFDALAPITWTAGPVAMRDLRIALHNRSVSISMTDSCLHAFSRDAVDCARATSGLAGEQRMFSRLLHDEVERRADFIRDWTQSDLAFEASNAGTARWVQLAHDHSLPRAWKLTEPVARSATHATPTYLYWAETASAVSR